MSVSAQKRKAVPATTGSPRKKTSATKPLKEEKKKKKETKSPQKEELFYAKICAECESNDPDVEETKVMSYWTSWDNEQAFNDANDHMFDMLLDQMNECLPKGWFASEGPECEWTTKKLSKIPEEERQKITHLIWPA